MKPLNPTVKYFLFHAPMAVLLYYATIGEVAAAANLFMVITWAMAAMSVLLCIPVVTTAVIMGENLPPRGVPSWLDYAIDTVFIVLLAWYGHVVTSLVYLAYVVIGNLMIKIIRQLQEKYATELDAVRAARNAV